MKTTLLLILLLSVIFGSIAQEITISFQPQESGILIDSVWVSNQKTDKKVKLFGNESLTLTKITRANFTASFSESGYLYPNPCSGDALLSFSTTINQEVELRIYNISGQLLSFKRQNLAPNKHRFQIKFPVLGIYTVTVLKNDMPLSFKVACTDIIRQQSKITYLGSESPQQIKNATVGKTLSYTQGDILHYSVFSGENSTIITDSPTITKFYPVEFYECIDKDKQSYPVVKIGNQIWMSKNLQTTKYQDGTDILNITDDSKWEFSGNAAYCWFNNDAAAFKSLYGALYNWNAVGTGKLCPTGWHVPSDAEWKVLYDYIYKNHYSCGVLGEFNARALASKMNCITTDPILPCSPGYDPANNNITGFSALLGGQREFYGEFRSIGEVCRWWSSTKYPSLWAYYCGLSCDNPMFGRGYYNYIEYGFSVRCIKD